MPANFIVPNYSKGYDAFASAVTDIGKTAGDEVDKGIAAYQESKKSAGHVDRLYKDMSDSLMRSKDEYGMNDDQIKRYSQAVAPTADDMANPDLYEKKVGAIARNMQTFEAAGGKGAGYQVPDLAMDNQAFMVALNTQKQGQTAQQYVKASADASTMANNNMNFLPPMADPNAGQAGPQNPNDPQATQAGTRRVLAQRGYDKSVIDGIPLGDMPESLKEIEQQKYDREKDLMDMNLKKLELENKKEEIRLKRTQTAASSKGTGDGQSPNERRQILSEIESQIRQQLKGEYPNDVQEVLDSKGNQALDEFRNPQYKVLPNSKAAEILNSSERKRSYGRTNFPELSDLAWGKYSAPAAPAQPAPAAPAPAQPPVDTSALFSPQKVGDPNASLNLPATMTPRSVTPRIDTSNRPAPIPDAVATGGQQKPITPQAIQMAKSMFPNDKQGAQFWLLQNGYSLR